MYILYIRMYVCMYIWCYEEMHVPFWYPDQPQHHLQNAASVSVTLQWILTLLSSIHQSIAPVNCYEILQTMAFQTTLVSANSYDLLSLSWSCQSTRSKELLWNRFVLVVCLLLPLRLLSAPVNSRKEFTGDWWVPGRKTAISEMGFHLHHCKRVGRSLAMLLLMSSVLHYWRLSSLSCPVYQIVLVLPDLLCRGRGWTFFTLVCLVALTYVFSLWAKT